jgi:ubiquitin-like protein Pup
MMAEREQSRRSKEAQQDTEDEALPTERESDEKLDELLDEIDQVLEENAEEFVRNYIQKGGE